jgi:hypothetical protein
MTNISRRTAIGGAGVAFAAAGLSMAAIPQTAANEHTGDLQALIDAHRTAWADYDRALDAVGRAEEQMVGRERPLTPVSVAPDGSCRSGKYEIFVIPEAEIRQRIAEYHQNLRMTYGGAWMCSMVPAFKDEMAAAIDASEQRAYAALEQNLADYDRRREEAGIIAAEAETSRTCQLEVNALAALWAYRPRSEDERCAKREYLALVEDRAGLTSADDMTVEAIMDLLRDEVMA